MIDSIHNSKKLEMIQSTNGYTHTVKYYSSIKKNKQLIYSKITRSLC